mgnify:CR=1 FL=1
MSRRTQQVNILCWRGDIGALAALCQLSEQDITRLARDSRRGDEIEVTLNSTSSLVSAVRRAVTRLEGNP